MGWFSTEPTYPLFVLKYDAWNRAVSVTIAGTVYASYSFDALGRRITESPYGGTTSNLYYSADWQVIEERQGSTATKQYVWGLGYLDDLLLRDDNSSGGSYGVSGSGLGRRLYVQQDANENVTALTNTSGAVQERFIYDPYGSPAILTAGWSGTSDSYGWTYFSQGGRYSFSTRLYNFRNRDYDPAAGRWLQMDPAGYVGGLNAYGFDNSDPSAYVDPYGTQASVSTSGPVRSNTPPAPSMWLTFGGGLLKGRAHEDVKESASSGLDLAKQVAAKLDREDAESRAYAAARKDAFFAGQHSWCNFRGVLVDVVVQLEGGIILAVDGGVLPVGPQDPILVDPGVLRLPPSRTSADPFKLARQLQEHGTSTAGMPPVEVTVAKNGEMMINNGVTRATRVAKYCPAGTKVPVTVIDRRPNVDITQLPTVGNQP